MLHSEHWINLRHLSKRRLPGRLFKSHRDLSHIQLERDLAGFTGSPQCKRCPQRRMAREGQLFLHRENSHPHSAFPLGGCIAWKNEGRLREVHLFRDRLHLAVTQSPRIGKNRQGIALQSLRGKYIPLRHRQPPCFFAHGSSSENINCSAKQTMIELALAMQKNDDLAPELCSQSV